jgi:hypothetical protein
VFSSGIVLVDWNDLPLATWCICVCVCVRVFDNDVEGLRLYGSGWRMDWT